MSVIELSNIQNQANVVIIKTLAIYMPDEQVETNWFADAEDDI